MERRRLDQATRRELYDLAQRRRLPGRSGMNRQELLEALDGDAGSRDPAAEPAASRFEAFRAMAQERARGGLVLLPRLLTGNDRRLHVRETLREDHHTRITRRCEDTEVKFDELAGSLYSFFRGTCLLFYRDLAGEDATMPTVLALGDVHPENFGVMPNADNVPIFGVNDFDEAYYAPFTFDLKRGAVGFLLAAEVEGGHGSTRRRKIARRFVRGYVGAISEFARHATESDHQLRRDNAPELIRDLFDQADEGRREWLEDDYHDEYGRGFRADDELVPITSRRQEFQELVHRLVAEQDIAVPPRAGAMRVKDVAVRKGQGTASLGLARYYVLIEGQRGDGSDDLVLEFKQARRSALAGLVPPSEHQVDGRGGRIAHAQSVQLVNGDVFYGGIDFEGRSYMSRERAPFRDDIDLDDLSYPQWKAYAHICGRALAHVHALSDESGDIAGDVEPRIVEAIDPPGLFVDDVLRFAVEAAERVRGDHGHFRADHAAGAFRVPGRG
ncbi:DUF2252 family protein [Pseudonocardia sp. KRD-184]|uniref:DUF2252 family protein n=1 Tax=Pseudonocardia oceani TaxID=2792013 RepID=A0ABS6UFB3_9PSEU|nr:DUF2252 family protein [Pseudonocardia oceani]MBW0089231.1 DUF2252 family protein [Pseudonocardia oceani]MBW0095823.1 DUF2252 family protein [Pseudonocardia oceani]MBW0109556.1 DUF2252 family protein [Pseudonocardia oceani]MBW0120292.1 DUF2252 family protein [Pseudonocardia oceani]MBW0130908.1 DUF2252 family protein [Pseudonocardia oceani]